MASPHVAGAVALLLEARPHLGPREVQERLQNTARPALWAGNPGLGFLDNVHRQGAGMLHIDEAATADAVVWPSSLALGEIEADIGDTTTRVTTTMRSPTPWDMCRPCQPVPIHSRRPSGPALRR